MESSDLIDMAGSIEHGFKGVLDEFAHLEPMDVGRLPDAYHSSREIGDMPRAPACRRRAANGG